MPPGGEVLDLVMRYESEGLPPEEEVRLFQVLVDTGLAWELQGSYGRRAMALIEDGAVKARQ